MSQNLTPPPPLNPLTNRHQNLRTWLGRGYLSSCKISPRSDEGFRFCACAISRIKLFTRLFVRFFVFWGFFISSTAKTLARILTQNTSKDAVPHKDVPLGVAKPKVKLYTPFCSQNRHFGALFRLDFLLENAFNIGYVLYKRPLIVIVAP